MRNGLFGERRTEASQPKHRTWVLPGLAFFLALTVLVAPVQASATGTQASAQDVLGSRPVQRTCSERFYDALSTLARREVPRLQAALDAIVSPRADVPSRWYFWSPKSKRRWRRRGSDGMVRPLVRRGRVCTRGSFTRRGKFRCRRWARATPELVSSLTRWMPRRNPSPKRAVRRNLRFLNDTIVNNGAVSAFQTDGRFYWLVRRLVIDLETYLNQPPNPKICNGVPTIIAFYRTQLEPYEERIAYLDRLAAKAERRMQGHYASLVKLRRAAKAKAVAAAAAAEEAARKAIKDVAIARTFASVISSAVMSVDDDGYEAGPDGTRAEGRADLGQIAETAARAQLAAAQAMFIPPPEPAANLTAEAGIVRAFLHGAAPLAEPGAAPDPASVATFADARLALDVERIKAIPKRQHDTIVRGLRAAEMRDVAVATAGIYREFRQAVLNAYARISTRHQRSCTCE
ncbi:MAG: hypothetical protein AAFR70_06425 [Pseudomonadota bacterium]